MEIKTGKIVGATNPKWWGQVHDFAAEDETGKGRLVAAVSVMTEQNEDPREIVPLGREILARIQERYFGAEGEGPFGVLKGMLSGIREEFGEGATVAAGVFAGEYVFLGVAGEAGIWVKRKEGEGWVVKPEGQGEVRVFSGRADEGMSIVLGNRGFWEKVPVGTVKAAVTNFQGLEQEVESLAVMGESDGGEGKAAVIIKVGGEEKKEVVMEKKTEWREKALGWWQRKQNLGYVVHGDKTEGRKKTTKLGYGFLVFLLAVTVGGNIWHKEKVKKSSAEEMAIGSMIDEYRELAAIAEINPDSVKVRMEDLKLKLEGWSGNKDARISEIRQGIEKLENIALGVREVNLEEVVDMALVREGIKGGRMTEISDKLAVVDSESKRMLMVDIKRKAAVVAAGEKEVMGMRLLAGYPGKIMGWGREGVVECTAEEVKCALVIKTDSEWKEIKAMGVWGGNIYLLDAGGGQIFRYQRLVPPAGGQAGYGKKENWVATGQEAGLAGAESMTIDGQVWVVKGGEIMLFNRGNRVNFEVTGWDKPMGAGSIIFTSGEENYLYVLDKQNGRVIVISKTGKYEKQLRSKLMAEVADMVVDETGGKIYLLIGSKIMKADLP